tara:strand:- start:509 stop:979 length:471 start_codon:yes stop_codon:yes gene_type:complete
VGLRRWRGSGDPSDDGDDVEHDTPAAFDAVNLYELYRSMRALRTKLAGLKEHPEIQRAYLVGRPDSVMAFAHLADRDQEAPVVRYLVLRELYGVLSKWAYLLDADLVSRAKGITEHARTETHAQLVQELGRDPSKADAMLDWFEQRLSQMDPEAVA